MATAKETAFLNDFVTYLKWKLSGSDPTMEPTKPTVSFKALLGELPAKDRKMRAVLLKHMKNMQESRGQGDIPPKT